MLLRHTVSALALAATFGLNAAPMRAPAPIGPTPSNAPVAADETGGGPGATCLGCVAAGVVTLATFGWTGVYWLFMAGGSTAVAAGTAVATCTAACTAYFAEE